MSYDERALSNITSLLINYLSLNSNHFLHFDLLLGLQYIIHRRGQTALYCSRWSTADKWDA